MEHTNDPFYRPKVDIIWNHTVICSFPCSDCCVAATHVRGSQVSSPDLADWEPLSRSADHKNKFHSAQVMVQQRGIELTFAEKLSVMNNMEGVNVRVDISGGDALIVPDGLPLLQACSKKLGKSNVTLTITGAGVKDQDLDLVASLISEFNFTFNSATPADSMLRPKGYAATNLGLARKMIKRGVTVRAECPLTRENSKPQHIERLYRVLADEGVQVLLLMRQFPVGRGQLQAEQIPTREEYISAIATARELEARLNGPIIKLQCALRHLEVVSGLRIDSGPNPCDLGRVSYGLMADGTLLASPWALNKHGRPLHEDWVLGSLRQATLIDLLRCEKARQLAHRADDNRGHCKIFAAMNSTHPVHFERIFSRSDPLYAVKQEKEEKAA